MVFRMVELDFTEHTSRVAENVGKGVALCTEDLWRGAGERGGRARVKQIGEAV